MTVISGALTLLHDEFHMTNVQQELVVGGTTFGAIFGGFFSGLVSSIVTESNLTEYIYLHIFFLTSLRTDMVEK